MAAGGGGQLIRSTTPRLKAQGAEGCRFLGHKPSKEAGNIREEDSQGTRPLGIASCTIDWYLNQKLFSPSLNYRKLKSRTQEGKAMVQSFNTMDVEGFVVLSLFTCSLAQIVLRTTVFTAHRIWSPVCSTPSKGSFKRGLPLDCVKDLLTELCGAKDIYN